MYRSPRLAPLVLFTVALLLASCGTSHAGSAPTAPSRPASHPAGSSKRIASPLKGSYAALGASETYGVGASPATNGYAYKVARGLHAVKFRDEGIPGASLPSAYQTELTGALPIRPALATVFFGFNDLRTGVSRKAYLQNLNDLVVTLRRAGAKVLIIGLPDLSLLPAVHALFPDLHSIIASWNGGTRAVARKTGAHFLDLRGFDSEIATHPNYIAADGLHPSNAGHARLAQVVLATIRKDGLWQGR